MMYECLDKINKYASAKSDQDKVFKLFKNAIEDWLVYMLLYIAIRSGDWTMRITGYRLIEFAYFSLINLLLNLCDSLAQYSEYPRCSLVRSLNP